MGQCITDCSPGYYVSTINNTKICQPCSSQCLTCTINSTNCIICSISTQIVINGTCT